MGGNTVDGEHRGGVGDKGVNTDNWAELDPDNLNAEEGYSSTHTSQDGDDGPTQENIDRCDLEFRDLAKEYNNIFAEEEDAVHSVPPQPSNGELSVGMESITMYECRAYIKQWLIMNKFEYYQEKNENYRVKLFYKDENYEWTFYARRTTDGHTFTLRKNNNLKHTCSSGAKNILANTTWVAKQVESVMMSMRTTTHVGIQELISIQFGIDISYYTAWNAWSMCKEKIVGSYDEGYIMQPELWLQILHSNPGSIVVVSKNHDTSQWTGTCVMFKASIDRFLNGCKPIIGLDGCFLKGKYGGVCLLAIGLDGNNGLFPLKYIFVDRQKRVIDAVANIFPFVNHRFCFRHMYKNMKKVYRGTHLESWVWKAARAYKQVEKKNMLDELKLDNPSAHDWLMKEPFEHWARSHFDFTAKCEHITNNFSESFNNWILKIRDKPLYKALEKLNLMLMKLMFDRRQKAKDWEEKGLVLMPRAQTHIDKLKRQYGQYRIEGTKKGDLSGQRWRVNEWQVTGLPCVHTMFVIVPYRYSWANFVSEYHKVSSYVKAYKDAIYPVVNPLKWGHPQPPYFLPPPLVRGPGRPRKERIHDPDEKRPHKRCGTCGCFGHNKTTCIGPSIVPTPRVVRTRQKLDTNTSRVNFMINISLQVDAGGERDVGRTRSGGRTGRNTVGGRTSTRKGRDRGGGRTGRNTVGGRTGGENVGGRTGTRGGRARGGGRTGRNTVGGRTGGENIGGRTGTRGGRARGGGKTGRNTVGGRTGGENIGGRTGTRGGGARGGARGRTNQTFQAPRQSEGVTQVSTSQAPRHSQGFGFDYWRTIGGSSCYLGVGDNPVYWATDKGFRDRPIVKERIVNIKSVSEINPGYARVFTKFRGRNWTKIFTPSTSYYPWPAATSEGEFEEDGVSILPALPNMVIDITAQHRLYTRSDLPNIIVEEMIDATTKMATRSSLPFARLDMAILTAAGYKIFPNEPEDTQNENWMRPAPPEEHIGSSSSTAQPQEVFSLQSIESILQTVSTRLGAIEGRLGTIEDRLETIETYVRGLRLVQEPQEFEYDFGDA
ncbi:hypothetical protein GIB67_036257 [Kingdonia uniflora]|uniref:Transposase n=1 Tax=Kingdonia uniflora TaxID=39325 RepID=A0A7J7P937_9MAGN|nr:hypothetical protein GIB67_036257 [Kingdonia uniflora]